MGSELTALSSKIFSCVTLLLPVVTSVWFIFYQIYSNLINFMIDIGSGTSIKTKCRELLMPWSSTSILSDSGTFE